MRAYSLRVWPNGEFGLGVVKRFQPQQQEEKNDDGGSIPYPETMEGAIAWYGSTSAAFAALCPGLLETVLEEVTIAPQESPLGLSNGSNSHTPKKRGLKGLTTYAKRMLRNGCYLLEKWAGKRNCALLTCTLPDYPEEIYKAVTHAWPEIVRVFTQWLHRRLKAAGGCPWVLGCVEIQEKRMARYGGLPLHLHLTFQARSGKEYTVNLHEISRVWMRCVSLAVPDAASYDYSFATRIELIKKSVAAYLSKYLSKGVTNNVVSAGEQGYKIPSSWWVGVGRFKRAIARMMICTTGEDARMVHSAIYDTPSLFRYSGKVYIGSGDDARCVGWYGTVTRDLYRLLAENRDARRASGSLPQLIAT